MILALRELIGEWVWVRTKDKEFRGKLREANIEFCLLEDTDEKYGVTHRHYLNIASIEGITVRVRKNDAL